METGIFLEYQQTKNIYFQTHKTNNFQAIEHKQKFHSRPMLSCSFIVLGALYMMLCANLTHFR